MIERLLIANRGEIAHRIAGSAHRLGISTVGVYSDADRDALHLDAMDVAVALGGSTPAESYLRGEALVQAALDTGADAVHPGYGFLAESAAFARAVIDAGLIWVGPTPEQIALLGDKVAAKRIAVEAGVLTAGIVEAPAGDVPDAGDLFARGPVLVKAAAGGGGRGMRVVRSTDELADAVESASREAQSAFGDGTVFLEPYIERGRHVEVQIVGDSHGNLIHLHERECSIQRRNQKLVEESPSPGIDVTVRAALLDGAVALGRHVSYLNAGTVEFLVADDGTISFLEVNTRLQVEHRVTELVTGLDLVELQLSVAGGGAVPEQAAVASHGAAIEVRLVAEDPGAGWLPSTGSIARFDVPDGVLVDTAVRAGSVVSSDYDSLVAKVVAWGSDRDAAARVLRRALLSAQIAGVATNVASAAAIVGESDFLAGATRTSYLDEHPDVLSAGPAGEDELALLLGAVFADELAQRDADPATGFAPSGWRNLRTQGQRRAWRAGDVEHHVEYTMGRDRAEVLIGAWPVPGPDGALAPDERRRATVRLLDRSPAHQVIEVDGVRRRVDVIHHGDVIHTFGSAGSITWTRVPRFVDHEAELAAGGPVAPLPGTVIAVHVESGQLVHDGQLLMVVEAMKMEHKITAHAEARVIEVRYAVGDRVDTGDLLVALEDPDA